MSQIKGKHLVWFFFVFSFLPTVSFITFVNDPRSSRFDKTFQEKAFFNKILSYESIPFLSKARTLFFGFLLFKVDSQNVRKKYVHYKSSD